MRTRWLFGDPELASRRLRLFCFPYAGGGGAPYLSWHRRAAGIDVQPVRLAGRESRISEPPVRQMTDLVEELVEGLSPFLGESFALFGHSMGAVIAFELARRMEREGRAPTRLLVSGRVSPDLTAPLDGAHLLTDDELAQYLREFEATPAPVLDDPELRAIFLPAIRADFELCETYRFEPEPLLACPITAFYGEADGASHAQQVRGWHRRTTGGWSCRGFAGGHFFPFMESSDAVLGAVLEELQEHAVPD